MHITNLNLVVILAVVAAVQIAVAQPVDNGKCRLVAVGDLHGDLVNAKRVLKAAALIDSDDQWVGGCSTLVQTGDLVDRGAQSLQVIDFFLNLKGEAAKSGGKVHMLLGNHEMMNFEGITHYVNQAEIRSLKGGEQTWKKKFSADGDYGSWMQQLDVVVMYNGTVFVHGGLLPSYASIGIDKINRLARHQLKEKMFNVGVLGDDGPTWTRDIIYGAQKGQCRELNDSLKLLGAHRMVIGHTIQETGKISQYCKNRLVAIDVGMSSAIYDRVAGIEILDENRVVPIYE